MSGRNVNIGGNAVGNVIQTGDHNTAELRYKKVELPPPETDIPRIPDRCETRIVPPGVLSNGKSRTACAAGGQNRQLTAPRH